jgi:general stress protein CsbA
MYRLIMRCFLVVFFCAITMRWAYCFELQAAQTKSFVKDGKTYLYTIAPYAPPQTLSAFLAKRPAGAPRSPEDAVVSFLSAAKLGDVDWSFAVWSVDDARKAQSLFSEMGITNDRIKAEWASWRFNLITLTYRIAYGNYVLVVLTIPKTNAPNEEVTHVLQRQIDGSWLISQDLTDDALACCWRNYTQPKPKL